MCCRAKRRVTGWWCTAAWVSHPAPSTSCYTVAASTSSSRCPHQRLHHGATGHAPDLAAAPQVHAVEQAKEEAGCKQVACTRGVHRLAAGREAGA